MKLMTLSGEQKSVFVFFSLKFKEKICWLVKRSGDDGSESIANDE